MKTPTALAFGLLAVSLLTPTLSYLRAQDTTPPVVLTPIGDITVPMDSPKTKIKLNKTFGLNGVHGTLVQMTTNQGNIDLELFDDTAPNTVANFLRYVTSGSYTNTVIHRSTSLATDGLAIIQGGETTIDGYTITPITTFGNVANEYSLPDTRGTIAMAKVSGSPDSASDQWFFNVSDNSDVLDSNNNGGFTVFGRVIEGGMTVVDAISALQTYNLSSIRSDWTNIPLHDYDSSAGVDPSNLVVASGVDLLPLVSKGAGYPGVLKVKVKSNTNPDLVTATLVSGKKLVLTYAPGQTGTAMITLQAKSVAKGKVKLSFNVTVQ